MKKGQIINLSKESPELKKLVAGIGWDMNPNDTEDDLDPETQAFLLPDSGMVSSDRDLVFWYNLRDKSGAVVHLGDDDKAGISKGDEVEFIAIDLTKVPDHITKIVFTITAAETITRHLCFAQVKNVFIRMYNQQTGEEIFRYDLGEDYSTETAVVFGELYQQNGEWEFNAAGRGFQGGLEALCTYFGLEV